MSAAAVVKRSAADEQPLTIALIVNLYPPYIVGGNEILAHNVAEALRKRGHTVHILTGRGARLPQDGFTHAVLDIDLEQKEQIFLGGLPLTAGRLVKWHLYNHRSQSAVVRTLRQLQPDMVIAWNLYMASAAPLIGARRLPFPLIAHPADKWLLYSLDDITKLAPGSTPMTRFAMQAVRRLLQPLLKQLARPDYILAVSEFIRTLHTQAGYPSAQSLATYLGVPTTTFQRQQYAWPGQRRWRLIFVGQLWAGKGPQVAVEAVHLLAARTDLPPVELDIFGSGTPGFQAYLQQVIDERNLQEVVHLRGFVSHDQLVTEFHSHDVYLFCSLWDEPFSGGLLEAMATGLPTIATTAGGTPEAVRHEHNGLLVRPDDPQALADALARLMHDASLYEHIGEQAAAEVETHWTFERYIDRLERVYRAIATQHRPGEPIDLQALAGVKVQAQ